MNPRPGASSLELRIGSPRWLDAVVDWNGMYPTDEDRMRLVIRLARENVRDDLGGPFAAAVFDSRTGAVIAAGVNSVVRLNNSVLHAEVMALMIAQVRIGSFTLRHTDGTRYELVSSCEPCAMCLGATLWSGVHRLVCGATRADAVAIGFDEGPVFDASYQYLEARGIAVVREVLRDEAAEVLALYRRLGGPIYNA